MLSLPRSVALLTLLALSSVAHADDKAVQKALAGNYAKLDQAFLKNDQKAFSDLLSPNYIAIQPNNDKMTAKEVLDNFKRERTAMPGAVLKSKVIGVTVKGDLATVSVQESLSGVISDPRSKQPHNLVMLVESEDTWVKKNGTWKLKVYQMNSQSTLVDGKPRGAKVTRTKNTVPSGNKKPHVVPH